MALHTLRRMRAGGIWDQLGGGLHRYSVDQYWLAPHFEKMLYDQAMLARVAVDAWLATGDNFFRAMSEDIFAFALRELISPEGAFCAALDADSEGVEGTFYLWTKKEIDACLGRDAGLFCRFHAVTEEGNFEERAILTAPVTVEEFCRHNGLNIEETTATLSRCRSLLLERREERIRPLRDDKIITSWNGLMISALASAGIAFNNPEYISAADRAASFILANLRRPDGRLLRSYLNGASEIPAFLEDYAFLTGGLLDLYEATLDAQWLNEARILANGMQRLFRDSASGEFTLTGHDAEQMPVRVSSDHDGVTPSAFSRAAHALYRLAWIDDTPELLDAARAALDGISADLQRNPLGHLGALQVLARIDSEPTIASFTGATDSPAACALNTALHRRAISNLVIRCEGSSGLPTLSLCVPGTCYPAVATPEELERLLGFDTAHPPVNNIPLSPSVP